MFIANDKDGKRIDIFNALNTKNNDYFCPMCKGKLLLKNGKINISHFAHVSLKDCDSFTNDMSEWHYNWQCNFPEENREVIVSIKTFEFKWLNYLNMWNAQTDDESEMNRELYIEQSDGEMIEIQHRADVLINGYVIEFQHSPISALEFNRRNAFYTFAGYKVIWIFDMINNTNIEFYEEWQKYKDNGAKYKWKHSSKFLNDFIPQHKKNILVFFQFSDSEDVGANDDTDEEKCYMEKIIWAIEDKGTANYSRFFTSYYPANKTELMEFINKK